MANGFTVDLEVLQQIINDMDNSIEKFDATMDAAYQSVLALTSTWTGPANDTFRMGFMMDHLLTEFDIRQMKCMISNVDGAKNRYRTSEQDILAEVHRIQI